MNGNQICKMSRRRFLSAVPAVASTPLLGRGVASAVAAGKGGASSVPVGTRVGGAALAINGGKPVRTTPLDTGCPGTQFYDEMEERGAAHAVETHSLFRWYGAPGHGNPPTKAFLGESSMPVGFLGTNYRMNEMVGAVMGAQLKKLDTILDALRQRARGVRERIRELPGIKLRPHNDPDGEVGVAVAMIMPGKEQRDQFVVAMKAENVVMSPPSAAVVLTVAPYIEQKLAPHPAWPTFNTPRGKEIRYGAECCPRTLDLFNRTATLTIGPKYGPGELEDIVAAITKVHRGLLA